MFVCFNKEESKICKFVLSFMFELFLVRVEFFGFFIYVFLGDSLVVEYFILYFIFIVYIRRDVFLLGKFIVNLSGCLWNSIFIEYLY